MRSLINLLIMAFVIGAVWFQFKQGNIPGLSDYFKTSSSSIANVHIPDSIKTLFAPLTNLTNGKSLHLGDVSNLNTIGGVDLSTFSNLIPSFSGTNSGTGTAQLPSLKLPSLNKITEQSTSLQDTQVEKVTTTLSHPGQLSISGVVVETNKARAQQGLANLNESSKLNASAKVKAEDILARQYFEHIAPDGKSVGDLTSAQGYTYLKIGENLALGSFKDDQDVVTAWMNSPGHRANILDGTFTEIGIGIAYGTYQGREVSVAVQHFGRPRSTCPTIDESIKKQVESGQQGLDTLTDSLTAMKAQIDQGRAQGQDMTTTVIIYNNGVDRYRLEYDRVDALRTKYNAQVTAFNACLNVTN